MPRKQQLDDVDAVTLSGVKRAEKQESTRSIIALVFVIGYLFITLVLIFFSAFKQLTADTAKDYLLALGTGLGFIIGFYFKANHHE